ncbi:SHOCT domain-containing protein [Halobellus rubicundus]|uniref:SHOCT domain-containing protein n=1 Tax=Halobellus rubicundus TaxID=2996466 RepID=A0ABD5MB42_9EURY
MTVLHRLGTRLSAYVAAVARSPPLFGLVVGLWIAVLSAFTLANPLIAFLVTAPTAMLFWYGVLYASDRLRGTDAGESTPLASADTQRSEADSASGRLGGLFGGDDRDDAPTEERAIQRLRTRYAEGEIDHEEFERRLEALVETEGLLDGSGDDRAADRERSVARER